MIAETTRIDSGARPIEVQFLRGLDSVSLRTDKSWIGSGALNLKPDDCINNVLWYNVG